MWIKSERDQCVYAGIKTPTAFIPATTSLLDHPPFTYHCIKESCEMQRSISQSIITNLLTRYSARPPTRLRNYEIQFKSIILR